MDIRKLTRVERNEIIKKFLESNDVGRLYKCIVANAHLKMDHIIYLASFYGLSEKCCTLKDWNSQYARIIQGEKSSIVMDNSNNDMYYYFAQSQTTAQQPVKTRTMDSLLNTLNKLTIMSITSENRAELSLIEASVRDFLFENDILSGQETDDEMIKNLAGMLASTCVDFDSSKFQPKGLAWDYKTNARFVCNLKNIYDDLENLILKKEQQVQETKKPVAQRKNQTKATNVDSSQQSMFDEQPVEVKVEEEYPGDKFYLDYMEVQKKHPTAVVATRLGDFYEILGDKAKYASDELNITLVGRACGPNKKRIPMVGFPYYVAEIYFEKIAHYANVIVLENGLIKEIPQIGAKNAPQAVEIKTEEKKQFVTRESVIDEILKRGSGFADGKFRIYNKGLDKPSKTTFAQFLEKEYGIGGGGYLNYYYSVNSKGLKIEHSDLEPFILSWSQVAQYIQNYINNETYLTTKELYDYKKWQEARWNDELQNEINPLIDNIDEKESIDEVEIQRVKTEDELITEAQELAQQRVLQEKQPLVVINWSELNNEKLTTGNILTIVEAEELLVNLNKEHNEVGYYKTKLDIFLINNDNEIDSYEGLRYDIGCETGGIIDHIEGYAQYYQETGKLEQYEGLIQFINNLKKFTNHSEIEEIIVDTKEEAKPNYDETIFGGPKTRFYENVKAIRILKQLENEQRDATSEEKTALARYVGWGGISQAFDEHLASWNKEYTELKELLTDQEYKQARGSVLNAHYTAKNVVDGIYSALSHLGVKGSNKILEPSMGVGVFFSQMPNSIIENSKLYGVELDSITGRIAKYLYPSAEISIKGFEETNFNDDTFDLVVGNVPFGDYSVDDRDYNKHNFLIHDYFIVKSIDKTRAGGVVAVLTSSGTLDKLNYKARKYMADRAELVGAMRLPNSAFKASANTDVSTDILFFKKREQIIDSQEDWIYTEQDEINKYYTQHPEMVLGVIKERSGRFGPVKYVADFEDRTLEESFKIAIQSLPQNVFVEKIVNEEEKLEEVSQTILPIGTTDVKNYCLINIGNKIYQRQNEELVEQNFTELEFKKVNQMIDLRKCLRNILELQLNNCSDNQLFVAQSELNSRYDIFVEKYGYLTDRKNQKLFSIDADSAIISMLEDVQEIEGKKIVRKGDIFTKRTIKTEPSINKVDNVVEAMNICRNTLGYVDIQFIENLTDKNYDLVVKELGDLVFRNPKHYKENDKYSGFETAETYLSGDVKTKLEEAKIFATKYPELQRNVNALQIVQPAKINAEDIYVRLGTLWIEPKIYHEFFCELMEVYSKWTKDGLSVNYNDIKQEWIVRANNGGAKNAFVNSYMATQTFGTSRVSAKDIFEACLNLRSISVHDYIELPDGKKKAVVNEKETLLAREKQEELKQRFKDWIFSNPVRRDELEELYNDKYNRTVNANYDGSYLQFKGINPNISLYPHQKNAIHRGITDGSALFHHCVGAGKTFTICATAMKLKEYGLAQKPMIVVPNAVIEQFANDFRKLFPNANLLVADKDDMNKANREMFVAKATFCEWDSIIITKSCFDRIGVSKEREAQAIEKDLQKIIEQIEEAKWSSNGKNGLSVKQLEQIRVSKTKLLKELYDGSAKDDMILFEELGVDYLFVDEAHNYKNKSFFTKMSNVAGLNPNGAKSASYLDLKIEYLNELHGGDKGVIFATGTPISNTMAEMWAMQTYLQRNKMERLGLSTFDGWASTFGEVVNSFELKPSGRGYQIKTRFAKFVNMPELMSLYCGIADVQTSEKLKLPVPEAKREIVEIKPSEETISVIDEIAERADKIAGGGVDASVDNMLKITSDGKKVALSARLYDDDIRETGVTKINTCVDKVASIYYETAEQQSTQIIFCDMSTPAPGAFKNYTEESPFNAYCQLKKELIELGIKEEEIQFIHDYEGKAKEKLQQNVKSGNVRILIGSTQKCGTGLNVQDKLIAVHHLDVPWRPSDMEQREGRIIRQGNTNKEVFIYNYVTERTFDAYSYQTLQNKQKFIYQITSGNISVRECEDIDEKALSYGEIKAIASGNPLIKRKVELESELHKLEVLRASYENKMYALKRDLASNLPSKLNIAEKRLENLKADKIIADANATEEFEIIIKGVKCEGRGNEVVATFMEAYNSTPVGQPFANYCGFNVEKAPISDLTSTKRSLYIKGNGLYEIELGESMLGTLTRIENAVNKIGPAIDNVEETIRRIQKDIADAKIEVEKPFAREEELRAMRLELSSINDELNVGNDQVIISEEANSEEVNKKVYRMMPTMEDLTKTYENDLSIDYEQEVFKSVEDEIQKFTDHIINMEKYEIYANASVIVAMNELYFAITNSERFSPSVYRALYEDKGYIMGRIAEQANDWEHTSYATMENTEDLILRYVNEKYKDLMDSYDRAVEMENEISNQIPFIDDVETEKLTIEQEADRWVENQEKQEKLQQFITKAISEIKWLNGKVANFTEDEIDDIVNDIKVDFEGSQFDESSEAEPFDLWYDWFIEETLIPELQSRVNEEYLQNETQRIEEKKALLKEATFDSAIKDTSSQEYQDFLKAGGGNSGVYDISDEANLDFVLQYSKFINKNEVVEKVDGELVRFFDEELQNNQSDKVTLELSNALMYSKGFMNFQLIVPKNEEYAESKVWLSKKFITKQTETNFEITLPKDYIVKLDTPLGAVKITSEKLAQLFRGNVFAKTSEVAQENSNIAPVGVKNLTLSPVRKELAEKIVKAMKEGNTEWLKCWGAGAPRNAITGRRYKGINNVMLSLVAYTKGYKDTRWLTFKQIQDKKWKLKKGSKGTPIELLKFMDKTTNKELDFKKFNELEEAEKQSYWKENVRILYKSYTVFNAENVEGIPAYDVKFVSEEERNENCEKLLNSIDTPIIYGGEEAYYSVVKDEIHLPPKTAFHSLGEFYGTAFHEAGHAQGPKLNLDMTGMFGSEKYALRELEVEFASAMLKQELGLDVSQKEINNNAGYIASWLKMAQQNPNVLISAINVGSKIADRLLEYMPDSGARKKDDLEEAVGLRMIELNNVNPIKPISNILNSNSKLNSGPTNNNIME